MIANPLGSVARSLKSWAQEQLRYATVVDTATQNSLASITSLNNDDKEGNSLAVWGILGLYTSARGLMQVATAFGSQGTFIKTGFQLKPDAAQIKGLVATTRNTYTPISNPMGIMFKADGVNWLQNGDTPLFILPPTWRIDVVPFEPLGLYSVGAMSAVTFLWGPYATPKLPKRSRINIFTG